MHKPTIDEWNWYIVMLGQALLGAISDNVKMITLKFSGDHWLIETIVEERSELDKEEMEEVADELSIYIEDIKDRISNASYKKVSSKIVVFNNNLVAPIGINRRVIFERKT